MAVAIDRVFATLLAATQPPTRRCANLQVSSYNLVISYELGNGVTVGCWTCARHFSNSVATSAAVEIRCSRSFDNNFQTSRSNHSGISALISRIGLGSVSRIRRVPRWPIHKSHFGLLLILCNLMFVLQKNVQILLFHPQLG